jgi:hypothetical protein
MIIPDSNSASSGYDIPYSFVQEYNSTRRVNMYYGGFGGSAPTNTKATISFWFKWGALNGGGANWKMLDTQNSQFGVMPEGGTYDSAIYCAGQNESLFKLVSTAKFKDTSAWYHMCAIFDSTLSTASDRVKIYVNGVRVTDFTTANYPAQNVSFRHIEENTTHHVGHDVNAGKPYAYFADMYYIFDQAKDVTDFGEFDANTGIWKPIEYTGTFGSYGYYWDFSNASNYAEDQSGTASGTNQMTEQSLSTTTAMQATDTPTNNFCTLRPAYEPKASMTLKEGGTVWQNLGNSNSAFQPNTTAIGTYQLSAGKWYWECTWTNDGDRALIGIVASLADIRQTTDWQEFIWWDGYNGWIGSSIIATETNPPSFDSINTIGIALDCDNQRITFSKDGGWLEASGKMNGSSPSDWRWDWTSDSDFLGSVYSNGNVTPMVGVQSDANTVFPTANINFGGYAATIRTSGGNSDANGYGNFAYPVPSGFYALCTKNLAKYG